MESTCLAWWMSCGNSCFDGIEEGPLRRLLTNMEVDSHLFVEENGQPRGHAIHIHDFQGV